MSDTAARESVDPRVQLIAYGAVIFDMDGVVTDTATLHRRAWQKLFDNVLRNSRLEQVEERRPFSGEDYRTLVDGRNRIDAIRGFLDSRGADIPSGGVEDAEDEWSVHGFAKLKNAYFHTLLDGEGVHAFPGTLALLHRLRAGGVATALVTASHNAWAILDRTGLADCFDTVVDGNDADEQDLPGKPDPALFVEAARRLGVDPVAAVVIEDAAAGVEAAVRGRFGLVVGVDRGESSAELVAAGADIVVDDLAQLDLGMVTGDPWRLRFAGCDPAHEGRREALTTLSNGYAGIRGAAPEYSANSVHYPGTYVSGLYNRVSSTIDQTTIEEEHLVNVPNGLLFDVCLADGRWWSEGGLHGVREERTLDLRTAVLSRSVELAASDGRHLSVRQRRFVAIQDPHLVVLETTLSPRGWSGRIQVRTGIDAGVENSGQPEYRRLVHRHLVDFDCAPTDAATFRVQAMTSSSKVFVTVAHRTECDGSDPGVPAPVIATDSGRFVQTVAIDLEDGSAVCVRKILALATSRDSAVASPTAGALAALHRYCTDPDELWNRHRRHWELLWRRFGVEVRGAGEWTTSIVNLHLFHVMQSTTCHAAARDSGVLPRGLHGEGYRGHVFWDETFVTPLVALQSPEAAQALLHYRVNRLPAARAAAKQAGMSGALFPWQSGVDGSEQTPLLMFNPRSGRWMADHTQLQRHVGLAIAHNAWRNFEYTGDRRWLAEHGAVLIIEVARAFAAIARYDNGEDRYHIDGVMGPDEFHDGYPGAAGQGVSDNAYTNVLAAWVCSKAADALELLDARARGELRDRLSIDEPAEPARWRHLGRRLAVPFHDGVISQFDGYGELNELDWAAYRKRYDSIARLDLILEAENDHPNRYKAAKQPDVLMLVYLFGIDGVSQLLRDLGYRVGDDVLTDTVDYYLTRTTDGSTLGPVVHAAVLARLDPDRGWSMFQKALRADMTGSATENGVHLGAMAGTIMTLLRVFAGLDHDLDGLILRPRLPERLERIGFGIEYRGHRVDIVVGRRTLCVSVGDGPNAVIDIRVDSRRARMRPGQTHTFALNTRSEEEVT
ncbi:beta-phosphoglucomutase family hydrolase [Nocardia mikamii]|uniref:beta-phosphoglucomutase family hydrolase n=1 Tax=Nocardia mikamii TaxID=508464 RepID=UPI0007A4BBFD|nr:beta-phosphoglucomutase family hydrolase [Nocardia mikamii]